MATLASLADGAKIKFGSIYGKPIIWRVIGQNHYGSGQVSIQTENIIKLACFDAIEGSNSDSNRKSYGNNNYAVSNIRQWLNSDAVAGAPDRRGRRRERFLADSHGDSFCFRDSGDPD